MGDRDKADAEAMYDLLKNTMIPSIMRLMAIWYPLWMGKCYEGGSEEFGRDLLNPENDKNICQKFYLEAMKKFNKVSDRLSPDSS